MSSGEIGLYGGTFDPPHFGHLNVAISMLELAELEEVWWIPAWQNPHKSGVVQTDAHHRMQMVRLMIADLPKFRVLPIECERQELSYTFDTVNALLSDENKSPHPRPLRLIIGDDQLNLLICWHRSRELLEMTQPLVARRLSSGPLKGVKDPIRERVEFVETPIVEIHATEIRRRLARGEYCGHLVPAKVLDYIYTHRLYSSHKYE
ncbi:MAG: nicotinate (nicotinamide) nucleotide adenylyltransferase [Chlamydiia bacterium]|nr:nicotinate (nicotinamide) nucleotide adenylyltransferase [Chlamydiia bacterium]